MEAASHPWPTLGVLLLRDGLVTKEDLDAVLAAQHDTHRNRISGSRLGEPAALSGLPLRFAIVAPPAMDAALEMAFSGSRALGEHDCLERDHDGGRGAARPRN